MNIFTNESSARDSLNKKDMIYINSLCPFSSSGRICGSWCSLFYYDNGDDKRSPYIILGCKGTDKKLYT